MTKEISIVTDSTASIPPGLATEKDIDVIPAIITSENTSYRDGVDIGMKEFMKLLEKSTLPTTAAPAPGQYIEVYERHPGKIISVHLGSGFSGIFSTAELAAREVGERVHPFDSQSASMGAGFMALRAADMAMQGATIEEILEELNDMRSRTTVFAALNTLENLRKGGRATDIQYWLSSMLQIKPILEIRDNRIGVADRQRTWRRCLNQLVNKTESLGLLDHVAVLYADTPDVAQDIAGQIRRFHPGDIMIGNIGPALATHGGPGIIGVAAVKR